MATATLTASTTISQVTGFCEYAHLCVGGNGWDPFLAEVYLGHDSTSNIPQQVVWDAQLSNGFDTGWVDVSLEMPPGGAAPYPKLTVDGGRASLSHQGMTYGPITQVKIHAAVAIAAKMAWKNLSVKFYKNGVETDCYSPEAPTSPILCPVVNTIGKSGVVSAEQIVTVLPKANDYTKVVISGAIEMVSPSPFLPNENDIFGQIYIFTSTCVPQMMPRIAANAVPTISTLSSRLKETRRVAANGRGDGQRGRRKRRAGAR